MNTSPHAHSLNLIQAAEQANALLQIEALGAGEDQRARRVFMRELGQSKLNPFEWLYLLSTLLALTNFSQTDAQPPQAAYDASAQA